MRQWQVAKERRRGQGHTVDGRAGRIETVPPLPRHMSMGSLLGRQQSVARSGWGTRATCRTSATTWPFQRPLTLVPLVGEAALPGGQQQVVVAAVVGQGRALVRLGAGEDPLEGPPPAQLVLALHQHPHVVGGQLLQQGRARLLRLRSTSCLLTQPPLGGKQLPECVRRSTNSPSNLAMTVLRGFRY